MTADEQAHIAAQRKLIVENLVNGVEMPDVCRAFKCSPEEATKAFEFAVRKIKSYCFERRHPAFICAGIGDARQQRQVFLHFLDRVNMVTTPKFPKLGAQPLDEDTLKRI
jgi:hypothetical protein